MLDSEFFEERGDATRLQFGGGSAGGSHGAVRAAVDSRPDGSVASRREQLYAFRDKIADQNNGSGKKSAASVSCTTLPMSQHNERENTLREENGLIRLNPNASSLSKNARTSTYKHLVVHSPCDIEDDTALSKSSSTARVPTRMKNIYNSDCESEDEACSILEGDQLFCSHEKTSNSFSSVKAEAGRRQKGERDEAKPKFSIHFQTHKRELCFHNVVKTENEEPSVAEGPLLHDIKHRISAHSMAELLYELQQENRELLESNDVSANAASLGKRGPRYSMSTLLEDLEKGSPLKCSKATKAKIVGRRSSSHLGNSNDEDAPDSLGSRTSSEDEDNDKNGLVCTTANIKDPTMADIFQEVFGLSTMNFDEVPFTTRTGMQYYGRLQQILQRDKDSHLEFLKRLYNNQSKVMNVKILSRLLDAKLTVCRCLLGDKIMNSKTGSIPKNYEETGETTLRTIIFSSKICRDVELEVGNFICIYPPWKEIRITDDSVILCTYFSPFMP